VAIQFAGTITGPYGGNVDVDVFKGKQDDFENFSSPTIEAACLAAEAAMVAIRSGSRKDSVFKFVLAGVLRVIAIGVCSIYSSNAQADSNTQANFVVCKSPGSEGALVDTPARCAFFSISSPMTKSPIHV